MIVTRDTVMAALFARIEVAAGTLSDATTRRNATRPAVLEKGGVDFAMMDGRPGAPEAEVEPDPPYYMIDEAEIAVTVAESDGLRDPAVVAALSALDAALSADDGLGGMVKGRMLWSLSDRDDDAVTGAAPDAVAIVAVTLEYETATRLGV